MKTIILCFLLFVSSLLFGQKFDYAYQVQAGYKNGNVWSWDNSKKLDEDITIKLDKSVVTIYNTANTILTTYEDLGEENGYDKDGDKYKTHKWKAIDDKNRTCLFIMTWYNDIKLVVYSVFYNDVAFRFYIRTNSLSNF
jgi:hypothetical protein